MRVWLHTENKIFHKTISIDRVKYAFDPKMVLHFYFHYKSFPGLRRAKRERERVRERVRERESRDHLTHSSLTRYSPSSLTRTPLRSHIQASASRILAPARSHHKPTNRSTHHLQIDPPRPPASHTHELISLCPSLTIGLVILIFLF